MDFLDDDNYGEYGYEEDYPEGEAGEDYDSEEEDFFENDDKYNSESGSEDMGYLVDEEQAEIEASNVVGESLDSALVDKGGRYLDPIHRFKGLLTRELNTIFPDDDVFVKSTVEKLSLINGVYFHNIELIAIAIKFDMSYKSGVNKANVTEFINSLGKNVNSIDIIRHILWYSKAKRAK